MNYKIWISTLILLFCLVAAASAATTTSSTSSTSGTSTTTTLSPQDALSQVTVSSVTLDPPVFYPYEEGTIAVELTNTGSQAVAFSQADLISNNIHLKNPESYQTMIYLGPGNSMTYTFLVVANPPAGNYFPLFTVASKESGSIRYPIKVEIDAQDVIAGFDKIPDDFAVSTKDTVNLNIVNPRNGEIRNVIITPEGEGATISPASKYIQSVGAGSSVDIPFEITPAKDTSVTFHISFLNGNNKHTTDVVLPIKTGADKTGAQIVVNNIESSVSGGTITLKGDVTNNGLTDAKSVLVTVGSPAKPINPNPVYAIGNLEPDDFSSFEVTYTTTGSGAVPILVEYKDADGNTFSEKFAFTANGNSGAVGSAASQNAPSGVRTGTSVNQRGGVFGSFGSGLNQIPVTEIIIGIIAVIVLLVAWRKGLLRRLADKIRKKPDHEIQSRER